MSQVTIATRRKPAKKTRQARASTKHRVINFRLLCASAVILLLAGAFLFVWYKYRLNAVTEVFEQRAAALEKEGRLREAANYLRRHLSFQPNDDEARLNLLDVLKRSVQTPSDRKRLVGLLYHTLGRMEDRHDLRLELAMHLWELGDLAGLDLEVAKLEKAPADPEIQSATQRIKAISLGARARPNGLISIKDAIGALDTALNANPGDITVASLRASLHQRFPSTAFDQNEPNKADDVMNRMVAANPGDVEALLARYMYLRRQSFPGARKSPTDANRSLIAFKDLETALAIEPNNSEALLFLANEHIARGGRDHQSLAEQKLLKVLELTPQDARAYQSLARLHLARGEQQKAIDVLTQGSEKLETPSNEVYGLLVETLIDLRRLREAEVALSQLEVHIRGQLPELSTDQRLRLENYSRLLSARLNLVKNNLGQAGRELDTIIASVREADVSEGSAERQKAHAMRAVVRARMGRLDLAAADWKLIADMRPEMPEIRLRAAVAYLELGHNAKAINELDRYLQFPAASPNAHILLVQAHLRHQLQLSPDERNTSEFKTKLDDAKKLLPDSWELSLIEVAYFQAFGTDADKGTAIATLQSLEKKQIKDKTFWARVAQYYQQLRDTESAERALSKYDALEPDETKRILARSALLVQQGRIDDASAILSKAITEASKADRLQLQIPHIRLLAAAHKLDVAQQTVADSIKAFPQDATLLRVAVEIALEREDFIAAERWETALKTLTPTDDFDWKYYRAVRLAAQYNALNSQAKSDLDTLVESLRSQRPNWFPVVALAGQYADLVGNRTQAIESYRRAIELGDGRPQTVKRLVTALYAEGQFNDANIYLARLGSDQALADQSLAIELAVKNNRVKEALELAQKAVNRGTSDPLHYVWLANLLSLDGQQNAAEQVFRDCIERFPKDNRVWNGLFTYLARTEQPERARSALDKWIKNVDLDDATKHSILAQGFQLLGDSKAAQEHNRAILSNDRSNVDARLRLAKSLLSTDALSARGEFEEVLKIDPRNKGARDYLASILAASGNVDDWRRAEALLSDGAQANDRLRAILLSRRGKNHMERLANCEVARRILMARLSQSNNQEQDLDRMLLAGIYEQEAAIQSDFGSPQDELDSVQAARDTLRPLVDRENPSVEYLVAYIRLLLRHLEREPAHQIGIDVEQRTFLVDDARLRIDELITALGDNAAPDRRFLPISFQVRVLNFENRRDEGLQVLKDFAAKHLPNLSDNAERAKLLLQLGNLSTSAGYHKEAEQWYRELLEVAPSSYVLLAKTLIAQNRTSDAIEVCLRAAENRPEAEVATVLAQLLPDNTDADVRRRVEPLIDSAMNLSAGNVDLLMSVAVRHVTKEEYEDAIRLFRGVIELQPNHVLALNNLATLLAEQPGQVDEARRYVEQAMTVAGRSPELLDTLGTVLIRSGQYNEAITALEEAVAGAARDPRYYFHLALAYQRSGKRLEAKQTLDLARQKGLDRAILTSGDRELLDSLTSEPLTSNEQK